MDVGLDGDLHRVDAHEREGDGPGEHVATLRARGARQAASACRKYRGPGTKHARSVCRHRLRCVPFRETRDAEPDAAAKRPRPRSSNGAATRSWSATSEPARARST